MNTLADRPMRTLQTGKGDTPFRRRAGYVTLPDPKGRVIEIGHRFDKQHGFRVFLRFEGELAINSWQPDHLITWLEEPEGHGEYAGRVKETMLGFAKYINVLQENWKSNGRPRAVETVLGTLR